MTGYYNMLFIMREFNYGRFISAYQTQDREYVLRITTNAQLVECRTREQENSYVPLPLQRAKRCCY